MQLTAVQLGDSAESWSEAGFFVAPAAAGHPTVTLANTQIQLTGEGGGFLGWNIDGVDQAIDGLPLVAALTAAESLQPHPNGVVSIDHVVVNTGDSNRTIAALEAAGLTQSGGRTTDSYGSPMRQSFFWAGDVILELVGPPEDQPATDATTGIFGLALVSQDLSATAKSLGDLMGEPKDAVQPGRQIAGLRGKTVGISLPIAVMSPHARQ